MLVSNALKKHDDVSPERYDMQLLGLHDDLARKVGQIMIENDEEFKGWILSSFIQLCPYITYQFRHEAILTARISQEGDQICVVTTDQENYIIRDFDASMDKQSQTEIDVKQLPGYVADVAYEYDAWVLSSCRQKLAFLRSVDGIAQLLVYDRTNQSTLIFDYEGCFLKSSLAFSSDNSKIMFITQDEQARKARLYAFSITDGLLLYEKIYQLPEIYAPLISDSGSYVAVITGIPEQTAPAAYHYAQHLCHLMVPQTGKHYVFYLDGRESVTDTALEHVWLDQSERFMYISSVQGIFCIELPCLETKVLDLESYPRIDYDSISEQAEWIGIHKETILMTDKDRLELANVHKEITCTFKHGIKNIQLLDFAANIFLIGGIDGHHSDVGLWNMDHLLDVLKQLHELSLEQILLLSDIYQCSKNEELYVVVGQQMKQLYMSLPLFAREYVESREHVLVLEDDQEFSAR